MPARKRPYIPKTKGCYECSQRRVHCDRAEPTCNKCHSKGIVCSGLGIRYRFNNDISATNKLFQGSSKIVQIISLSNNVTSYNLKDDDLSTSLKGHNENWTKNNDEPSCDEHTRSTDYENDCSEYCNYFLSSLPLETRRLLLGSTNDCWDEYAGESSRFFTMQRLNLLDSFKETCLEYFSEKIAGEMVVIDGRHNGWRYLVLPIAHSDGLVMDTVLAVSAFHYFANFGQTTYAPSSHYIRAIRQLQQRRDLAACDLEHAQRIMLAILVLLVLVMVNGSSDFPVVFKLLQSALEAVGGEEMICHGELGDFLKRQISKLRVFAAPFLSQSEGIETLSEAAFGGLEDIMYYHKLHPEHGILLSTLIDLGHQARNIYLKRAKEGATDQDSTELVETFKETLISLPLGTLGENSLVWATFMAASDSRTPEHQDFFREVLLSHYRRNGFVNLLTALKLLERIWSQRGHGSWTALLPEPQVLII